MNLEQLTKELLKNKKFKKEYTKKEKDFNLETDIPFEIGQRIFEARMAAKMSQKELAEKLNTKQPSIARAENGSIVPTIPFLFKIAKALGTYLILPQFSSIREKEGVLTSDSIRSGDVMTWSPVSDGVVKLNRKCETYAY